MIEKVATGEPGRRSPQLLALDDRCAGACGRAAARPTGCSRSAEGGDLDDLRERIAAAGCWPLCRHDDAYPDGLQGRRRCASGADRPRRSQRGWRRLRREGAVTIVGCEAGDLLWPRGGSQPRRRAGRRRLRRRQRPCLGDRRRGPRGSSGGAASRAAILGCGADVAYPRSHQRLYEQVHERGLILSELPPGTRRLALGLSGPQPDHGGSRRDHDRRRGGAAIGLADHRRRWRPSSAARSGRFRGRSAPGCRSGPTT